MLSVTLILMWGSGWTLGFDQTHCLVHLRLKRKQVVICPQVWWDCFPQALRGHIHLTMIREGREKEWGYVIMRGGRMEILNFPSGLAEQLNSSKVTRVSLYPTKHLFQLGHSWWPDPKAPIHQHINWHSSFNLRCASNYWLALPEDRKPKVHDGLPLKLKMQSNKSWMI